MASAKARDGVAFVPAKNPRFQKGHEKCCYDWQDPAKKWNLECRTHRGGHIIILLDWLGVGSGKLIDLREEGMLTGEALKDAKRLAEEQQFLAGLEDGSESQGAP